MHIYIYMHHVIMSARNKSYSMFHDVTLWRKTLFSMTLNQKSKRLWFPNGLVLAALFVLHHERLCLTFTCGITKKKWPGFQSIPYI